MKNIKSIMAMLVAVALVCTAMVLGSCDQGEQTYTVNVKDALGNPYTSGVVVLFMQDGEQIAMQACNESGVAEKTLAKGDYTVSLKFADDAENYYYDNEYALTADNNNIDAVVAYRATGETVDIVVQGQDYDAYSVSVGCTYVELDEKEMNYFLFSPKVSGNYEFSIADDSNATIGYYGAPHFVQSMNIAEVKDNSFTISVSSSMIGTGDSGTSTFVIGVESMDDKAESCVIGIERIGDPIKTIEDEPWSIYKETSELVEYTLPGDAEIKEFDLTASTDTYKLVYNEEDGYYHLDSEDGPIVLVRLAEDCDYIACFKTILDRSGVSRYFYDEDGNFVKKESYSECLLEYINYVDEVEGVYPLTEDLKYIIQQRGEYVGWWDIESNGYLFKDVNGNNDTEINAEIAWLLMCCYID